MLLSNQECTCKVLTLLITVITRIYNYLGLKRVQKLKVELPTLY